MRSKIDVNVETHTYLQAVCDTPVARITWVCLLIIKDIGRRKHAAAMRPDLRGHNTSSIDSIFSRLCRRRNNTISPRILL